MLQHCLYLLWWLIPRGCKQKAYGEVWIIAAVLSHGSDVIIGVCHTCSTVLHGCFSDKPVTRSVVSRNNNDVRQSTVQ